MEQEETAEQQDGVESDISKRTEPMDSMDEVRKQLGEKGLEQR